MAITINQLETGLGLLLDNEIYTILECNHVKPGKGSAFVRVRLKSLKTDLVLERTFRSSDKLEEVVLEERRLEYLYNSGHIFHFMDHETYEEVAIPEENLADTRKFLLDHLEVTGVYYKNQVQKIILPTFIEAEITDTEPGFKGDSSRSGTKPAKIATHATIQVPLFINKGDWVKIDTRTGIYVERVQR